MDFTATFKELDGYLDAMRRHMSFLDASEAMGWSDVTIHVERPLTAPMQLRTRVVCDLLLGMHQKPPSEEQMFLIEALTAYLEIVGKSDEDRCFEPKEFGEFSGIYPPVRVSVESPLTLRLLWPSRSVGSRSWSIPEKFWTSWMMWHWLRMITTATYRRIIDLGQTSMPSVTIMSACRPFEQL